MVLGKNVVAMQSLGPIWLWSHGLQHTRLLWPPLSPRVAQIHVRFIESVMLPNHLILCHPLLFCLQSFLEPGSFPNSWPFASVLPMNIQDWFPLGLTGLISLLSRGLSRVFCSTTTWKHQFFCAQPSFRCNSHICTWLQEKPQLWLYEAWLAKWCLCFLICFLGLSWLSFQGAYCTPNSYLRIWF